MLRVELFQTDRFLDLMELGLNEVVSRVTVCVVLGKSAPIRLPWGCHLLSPKLLVLHQGGLWREAIEDSREGRRLRRIG